MGDALDLQDAAVDAPDEALPEIVLLIEQMLVERGLDLKEPVTAEGEDINIVRDFLAARDVARALEAGKTPEPEDVEIALEDLREIYDYIVTDRAPP